ncbi:hypothetical protein J4462_05085 [Candidatus Pacearchaeota archaeon]|nr:hypothetical protein [Candidatus Pacearchaeota archaeon]
MRKTRIESKRECCFCKTKYRKISLARKCEKYCSEKDFIRKRKKPVSYKDFYIGKD